MTMKLTGQMMMTLYYFNNRRGKRPFVFSFRSLPSFVVVYSSWQIKRIEEMILDEVIRTMSFLFRSFLIFEIKPQSRNVKERRELNVKEFSSRIRFAHHDLSSVTTSYSECHWMFFFPSTLPIELLN